MKYKKQIKIILKHQKAVNQFDRLLDECCERLEHSIKKGKFYEFHVAKLFDK